MKIPKPPETPTLAEFIDIAITKHGAVRDEIQGYCDPDLNVALIMRRLYIPGPTMKFMIIPESVRLGDRLRPSVVRDYCRQLGIPTDDFGLKSLESFKLPN